MMTVKYVVYAGGILLLTLGIALTIQSNLGASPFDALLVGLSLNVGFSVGSWEIILACILICGNSLLSKQKPEILGLLTAFITGLGIDIWLFLKELDYVRKLVQQSMLFRNRFNHYRSRNLSLFTYKFCTYSN